MTMTETAASHGGASQHTSRRGSRSDRRRQRASALPAPPQFARRSINLLYLPALVLVAVFAVYPLVRGFSLSVMSWDGFSPTKAFVGFDNYTHLFHDGNFHLALKNTLIYGFGSTFFQQVFGLALALALDRAMRGRSKPPRVCCRILLS